MDFEIEFRPASAGLFSFITKWSVVIFYVKDMQNNVKLIQNEV